VASRSATAFDMTVASRSATAFDMGANLVRCCTLVRSLRWRACRGAAAGTPGSPPMSSVPARQPTWPRCAR
jgi:hypothetical protein